MNETRDYFSEVGLISSISEHDAISKVNQLEDARKLLKNRVAWTETVCVTRAKHFSRPDTCEPLRLSTVRSPHVWILLCFLRLSELIVALRVFPIQTAELNAVVDATSNYWDSEASITAHLQLESEFVWFRDVIWVWTLKALHLECGSSTISR